MFDRFEKRVAIEGTLRCVTALRIGAGRASLDVGATDLPVLRSTNGAPVIPGSSLKGTLRSALEALLRGRAPEGKAKAWACEPGFDPCVVERDPKAAKIDDSRKLAESNRERMKGLCWICQTFGAPGLASRVVFRDAYAEGTVHVERRDGVSLDRDLGRVSGARKYDFDVVPPGTTFPFGVDLESPAEWQEGLVMIGLDLLAEGAVRLGGMSSRGLGLVAVEDRSVRVLTRDAALAGDPWDRRSWDDYRSGPRDAWKKRVAEALGR